MTDEKPDYSFSSDDKAQEFLHMLTSNNSRIYAFIFSLVLNHSDTEDIMQETVTYMYQEFNKFQEGTNFLAWALRIAHFRVLSFIQKRQKAPRYFDSDLIELIEEETKPVLHKMNDRLEILRRCLKKLGEKDKALIRLRYEKGISVQNIAQGVGKSIHSIYRGLSRIHDKLLRCIRITIAEE
jgi:RNA polymerase sigma-70 factor (ECF subfamily)